MCNNLTDSTFDVCLFFYVKGTFLIHGCKLEDAEKYGDFLIYPGGHFDIWEDNYIRKFRVDYDFYPRGRVAYNVISETYEILYDKCIGDEINNFVTTHFEGKRVRLGFDEHYKCRKCNKNYVL